MARDTRYSIFYSHLIPSVHAEIRPDSSRVSRGRVRPVLILRRVARTTGYDGNVEPRAGNDFDVYS